MWLTEEEPQAPGQAHADSNSGRPPQGEETSVVIKLDGLPLSASSSTMTLLD